MVDDQLTTVHYSQHTRSDADVQAKEGLQTMEILLPPREDVEGPVEGVPVPDVAASWVPHPRRPLRPTRSRGGPKAPTGALQQPRSCRQQCRNARADLADDCVCVCAGANHGAG